MDWTFFVVLCVGFFAVGALVARIAGGAQIDGCLVLGGAIPMMLLICPMLLALYWLTGWNKMWTVGVAAVLGIPAMIKAGRSTR